MGLAGVSVSAEPPPAEHSAAQRNAALAQLVRGTSTRADVERLLGHASGIGASRMPPDWQPRDLWFYEFIKTGKMQALPDVDPTGARIIHVDMTQEILLVFFYGDLFDGYMWYTNAGGAEGRSQ
jgi:hypothetical protein